MIHGNYPCSTCLRTRVVYFTGRRWLCRPCWEAEYEWPMLADAVGVPKRRQRP